VSDRNRSQYPLRTAATSFSVLLGTCLMGYSLLWLSDFGFQFASANPLVLFREPGAVDTLTSFSEVTVGVLGIAITVVAIIVELAATRYTPRITELFLNDGINRAVMSYFVVTSVLVVWINQSLFGPAHPANMALAASFLMTTSLVAILPYFAYVFDFLSPTSVIRRIERNGSSRLTRLASGRGQVSSARDGVATAVEQLGDIALNSVDKKDKPLTIASLNALAEVARTHIETKERLPDTWFDSSVLVRTDQDFIAFHPDIVRTLTQRKTWVEMKIFRQYQAVFVEAVNKLRDINHLIAIQTRRVAFVAMDHSDEHVLNLCMRFINTYMRAAVNARDVRTCYNLLNEYRALAERAVDLGQEDIVIETANKIKYYAQLAFSVKLGFILESAAYDLCALLEIASDKESNCHDALLDIFLDVDREPEGGKVQETSLRGVRKAQIKLATHYLIRDKIAPARRIFEDMKGENKPRLAALRKELEAVQGAEFWEVSDRGVNFEWLAPDRRATLDTFFGWFDADID
jgi:hypothetical protein